MNKIYVNEKFMTFQNLFYNFQIYKILYFRFFHLFLHIMRFFLFFFKNKFQIVIEIIILYYLSFKNNLF